MKKSIIIGLLGMQAIIIAGIIANMYFTSTNTLRIQATQRVMVDVKDKLGSTFAFMDEVAANKEKMEEAARPLVAGTAAPEFLLEDENSQPVALADYKGKKTLLVFSQQSCHYCKDFYPVLNAFQEQQDEVEVVIMQLGTPPATNKQYKEEQGIKATMLATTQDIMQSYKVQGTPTSVLIDQEGRVLGSKTVNTLNDLMDFVGNS